jgi:tetratricopeptide (TPR) repeat protein
MPPHDATSYHELGYALEQVHRLDDAVNCYRQALLLNPQSDATYNNLGNCLYALGRFEPAHEAFRAAIRIAPENTLYYRNFVQSKRLKRDDPCFAAMQELVARAATLGVEQQVQLHFAYGQALADTGEAQLSFEHFMLGNALKRRSVTYDEAGTLELFARLPRLLSAEVLRATHGLGDPAHSPIFIVGMPRSGSSLIEQILASHPEVYGAGELPEFAQALGASLKRGVDDPARLDVDALAEVTAEPLRTLGADYLQRMQAAVHTQQPYRFITDKYLSNFIYVGLIHLALPNARIIHCRRNPVQTCLSSFSRLFNDVPFSYDLGELGRYYRAYDALMAHWRAVLPAGTMLEVDYESVVNDIEPNVRRLLAHCDLAWHPRCVDFHRTERQVITASAAQVREPLFKTSLQRWQPAADLVQPLLDGLGPRLAGQQGEGAVPA